jgi:penicillin-binding protein 1A
LINALIIKLIAGWNVPANERPGYAVAVALADFPDYLVEAVLATEDRRTIISGSTSRERSAPFSQMRAPTARCRSSITQQLAKNLFLNNERTIECKVEKAFVALWLETWLTKDEIFKLYLDRA